MPFGLKAPKIFHVLINFMHIFLVPIKTRNHSLIIKNVKKNFRFFMSCIIVIKENKKIRIWQAHLHIRERRKDEIWKKSSFHLRQQGMLLNLFALAFECGEKGELRMGINSEIFRFTIDCFAGWDTMDLFVLFSLVLVVFEFLRCFQTLHRSYKGKGSFMIIICKEGSRFGRCNGNRMLATIGK